MNQELLRALGEALREAAAEEVGPLRRPARRRPGLLGRRRPRRADVLDRHAGHAAPVPRRLPGLREPLRRDGQAGRLPDPPDLRRRRARGRARLRPADRLERRPARAARGQVRDHPRRRRLDPPAGRRRPRPGQGADHDGAHDRRRGGQRIGLVNRVVAPEQLEAATPASWSRNCSPTRMSPSDAQSASSTPRRARRSPPRWRWRSRSRSTALPPPARPPGRSRNPSPAEPAAGPRPVSPASRPVRR